MNATPDILVMVHGRTLATYSADQLGDARAHAEHAKGSLFVVGELDLETWAYAELGHLPRRLVLIARPGERLTALAEWIAREVSPLVLDHASETCAKSDVTRVRSHAKALADHAKRLREGERPRYAAAAAAADAAAADAGWRARRLSWCLYRVTACVATAVRIGADPVALAISARALIGRVEAMP